MLPLGGEVIESLIQKEYESYTLNLIFHRNNVGSRNTAMKKKKSVQCCLHFSFLCRTLGCGLNGQNTCFGNSTFREVESVTAKSSYVWEWKIDSMYKRDD